MRGGLILAATFTVMTATAVQAEGWCGYAGHAKSIIECGYSSNTECESAIGNGGMCFIDPDYASNVKRAAPATVVPAATAAKPG